jgi:hypothetical protein
MLLFISWRYLAAQPFCLLVFFSFWLYFSSDHAPRNENFFAEISIAKEKQK